MDRRLLLQLAESGDSYQVLRSDLQKFGNDADRLSDEARGLVLRIKRRLAGKLEGEAAKAVLSLEKASEAMAQAGEHLASAAQRSQKPPPKPKGPENPRLKRPWLNGPHRTPFVTAPGTGFNSS